MATVTIERTARLADVARAAGVAQGTVSNVFNHPELVREEVREHVRAVAKSLGYRGADPKGRLLRAGKVNAIGVATVEPLGYFFEDPFARVLMTGITEACDAGGAGISLVSAKSEEELVWNIGSALVDGLILFCLDGADRLIGLTRERQLPFVVLSPGTEDRTVPTVGTDNRGGAATAARYMAELGHRRFAVLSLKLSDTAFGPTSYAQAMASIYTASRDRVRGYLEALAPFGIAPQSVPIFETQVDRATIHAALEAIFSAPERPTALLAQSDRLAIIAMEWLAAHDIAVPGDVSVMGFDGVPESALARPPLTTMSQPIAEIGRRAVAAVIEPHEGIFRELLPATLTVRASTAPPRR